jgi:hypothetical protein
MNVLVLCVMCITITTGMSRGAAELIAYYPFDGNAHDMSGNGHTGTVYGAVLTADRFGIPGRAYSFDGVNDYILVPNADALNVTGNFTLAAWVMSRNIGRGGQDIISKTQGGCYSLTLNEGSLVNPSGTFSYLLDVDGPYQSVSSMPKDSSYFWYHVAGVYNGTAALIYVNGVLENSIPLEGPVASNSEPLTIGNECGQLSEPFFGSIDDVRIYSDALSTKEINDLLGVPVQATIKAKHVNARPAENLTIKLSCPTTRDDLQFLDGVTTIPNLFTVTNTKQSVSAYNLHKMNRKKNKAIFMEKYPDEKHVVALKIKKGTLTAKIKNRNKVGTIVPPLLGIPLVPTDSEKTKKIPFLLNVLNEIFGEGSCNIKYSVKQDLIILVKPEIVKSEEE